MASKRNSIVEITEYLNSLGIEVNIGKNKAQGKQGFFRVANSRFRIDIAKGQSEEAILKILAHEFAHYVHYIYDNSLKSLDFIFDDTEDCIEELLSITVESIPQKSVKPLFESKEKLQAEVKDLSKKLHNLNPNYNSKLIEQKIKRTPLKYLLSYDNVKVLEPFCNKVYSVNELSYDTEEELYIRLKSKHRAINRINGKLSRLNRYYNSPTELFARAFELYVSNSTFMKQIAPKTYNKFEYKIYSKKIKELYTFCEYCSNNL